MTMLVGNATKPTDENGDSLPVSVATIAALRAYPIPTTDGYPVNELGYYAAGDGGGQPFTWSASSILDDDGGSVVAPNPLPPSGRWHRMAGPMSFAHFGAGLRNGSADDTARCNAAINAAFRTTGPAEATIRMQRGVYPVTGIDLFATGGYGLRIEGQGSGNSIFTHWGSGTGPILSLADDHDVHLESFGVQGTGKSNTVRVLTKGNTATLFVNDQQVGTFDGTPPAGGGMAGFIGDSSDQMTAPVTFDFTDFAVAIP